jgi:hypothetical protein
MYPDSSAGDEITDVAELEKGSENWELKELYRITDTSL